MDSSAQLKDDSVTETPTNDWGDTNNAVNTGDNKHNYKLDDLYNENDSPCYEYIIFALLLFVILVVIRCCFICNRYRSSESQLNIYGILLVENGLQTGVEEAEPITQIEESVLDLPPSYEESVMQLRMEKEC